MSNSTVVLVGNGSLLLQCANLLQEKGHAIVAVVSENDAVIGWAGQQNIPVHTFSDALAHDLAATPFDWLLSIVNLRILKDDVLALPRRGAINFHDGPLPDYAGLNTPSWALMDGVERYGVTWHFITSGVDKGDIVARQDFDVAPDETAFTLNTKCFEAGIASFDRVLDCLAADTFSGTPQDNTHFRYFARDARPDALGVLDFGQPAEDLARLVRGLSFGDNYANPLVSPKIMAGDMAFLVSEASARPDIGQPGRVLAIDGQNVVIACGEGALSVHAMAADGAALSQAVSVGDAVDISSEARQILNDKSAAIAAAEPGLRRRLERAADLVLAPIADAEAASNAFATLSLPVPAGGKSPAALVLAFLARLAAQTHFSFAYGNATLAQQARQVPGLFASSVPLNVELDGGDVLGSALEKIEAALGKASAAPGYLLDLFRRNPGLAEPRLSVGLSDGSELQNIDGCAATFVVTDSGVTLVHDTGRLSTEDAARMAAWFGVFAAAAGDPSRPLKQMPILSDAELQDLLYARNATDIAYDRQSSLHQAFERQADATPDAIAVAHGARQLTFRELDDAANKLAHVLIGKGVGPDVLVGLHLPRSLDMMIAILGIHKAGGAYVPLDPEFPADRIAYMVEDSKALAVVSNRALMGGLGIDASRSVHIDDIAALPDASRPDNRTAPNNLAYVIYTSGSTGRPKGVMVEHGNVVNFFAGMDQRIPRGAEGSNVWLSVTSLSFDISVLELYWTLTRGFKVVLHARTTALAAASERPKLTRSIDFGLFYWGNDDSAGPSKYDLLLEGSRFADENGFTAVWTPERHFGAFGGPYPNPSVTGAAVAAVTKNLSIRAGSCVLPLHHPARAAEEWAVVDHLSKGRVGLAFASGWMPEDFVLRPENAPPNNKAALIKDIETFRRLWRGEAVPFKFGDSEVAVTTQPRPLQKDIPIWLTTAGNPETYREAARLGANVLTHLLGQSVEELAGKIRIYRETLKECGRDPADYKVTLMLHTLMGDDREAVRTMAREPMKDYLRSATALIKQYAWAFPAFKKPAGVDKPMDIDLRSLDETEMDGILDFAFERYFEDSGLFGTLEDGAKRIAEVSAIGVDEVACLIDYGVAKDDVMVSLATVAKLVAQSKVVVETEDDIVADGLAAEVARHRVTHLQCTPSMATLFLSTESDRQALADIRHLFIGGEALHARLVEDLRSATSASIENMYGPTETTIWSSTLTVGNPRGVVPIGTPIANTQLYVLDANQQPVPEGFPGELYIAGDGVARGYYERPDLTESRFLPNPFADGRMYRTGDLVAIDRHSQDRDITFLGRTDFQVKIRGFRIELGEIESAIGKFGGVREAVVMARTDSGEDARLIGYLRLLNRDGFSEDALRTHLAASLPSYMVPAQFVVLDSFPLTPNMKVDRNKLPAPVAVTEAAPIEDFVAPSDEVQVAISAAFKRALGIHQVGVNDNFFALGGHSLLAVQVHRDLKGSIAPDLAITDLFRYPTVAGLAAQIGNKGAPDSRLAGAAQRAAARRNMMDRRQLGRT